MKLITILAITVLLVCACKKSEEDKSRGHVINIADQPVDRTTVALDKLGSAIADASGDCAKLGASLRASLDEMKQLARSVEEPKRQELSLRMHEYGRQIDACKGNPDVDAFIATFKKKRPTPPGI